MRELVVLTILLSFSSAHADRLRENYAYYPQKFYDHVDSGEKDDNLKKELFSILSTAHISSSNQHDRLVANCPNNATDCSKHISLGYNRARKILFGELHLEKRGNAFAIRDVYCQHLSVPTEYKKDPPGPGQIPDPLVLNTEHTWPQSRFTARFDKDMQKSDLHILYPALANANTSRSNNPFGEVSAVLSSPCPEHSQRGHTATGGKDIFYEPPNVHKGNVARAIFYFSTRYQVPVAAEEEASLRAWHRMDPPDAFEKNRNETIFSKQKVRNPFIDHPELVDLISDF